MTKLTDKQELFCREYLIDLNATQAAIRAGYKESSAQEQSSRLLSNVMVQGYIMELKQQRNDRNKIDADYVLKRLVEIDQMDILDILAPSGDFLPIKEWPRTWRTTLSGLDIAIIGSGDTEAIMKKIKWPDKTKNLELLGKHVSVQAFKEKTLGNDMKCEYPSIPSEAFQQSIECAYYAILAQIASQHYPISHLDVYTYWDLGVGESTAIWFVRKVGDEFHIIDYYENSGEGLRHYMKVLKSKDEEFGYKYAEHWAPHDIYNRELSGDGKSRKQIAKEGYDIDGEKYSINFKVVPKNNVDDGIESVR